MKELTPRNYAWGAAVLVALCSSQLCYPILARSVRQLDYLTVNFSCQITTGVLCLAVIVLSEKHKRWQVWSSIALFPMLEAGRYLLGGMIFWIARWWSPYGPMLTFVLLVLFVFKLLQVNYPGLVTNFLTYFLSGHRRHRARARMQPTPLPSTPNSTSFDAALSLVIQQKKDWAEIVPLVERKNQYLVKDASKNVLLSLEDTSFATKIWALRKFPPFTFRASGGTDGGALQYHVPYPSFWRGEWKVYVTEKEGKPLGTIRHPFFTIRKTFLVNDAHGQELYRVVGRGFWHWDPWEYAITRGGMRIGTITNEWGGLAQEMLTDADTYSMTLRQNIETAHKYLLLGALLLLDLRYFEES